MTPRAVMRDVLGAKCADAIIADKGPEWALLVTVCAINERGGPQTERETAFMRWADRVTQDQTPNAALSGPHE